MSMVEADTSGDDLGPEEAREVTARIRAWTEAYPLEDIKAAYLGRVWVAFGYEGWSEWCDRELDGFKLPTVERRELVDQLRGLGMSGRAIASVTGADRKTIRRDLRKQVGEKGPPDNVVGIDGKRYKRSKPPTTDPGREQDGKERRKREQEKRDYEDGVERAVSRVRTFLAGYDQAYSLAMGLVPDRDVVLGRLSERDRTRFERIESETTWPTVRI